MPSQIIAIDLSPTSPIYSLALNLVIISIILSAFALGISRVLGSRKLWAWGVEELMQSVINAALLGIIISGSALSCELASSLVDAQMLAGCASYSSANSNSPLSYSLCTIDDGIQKGWQISDALNKNAFSLAQLSSMQINLNVISATPFSALSNSATAYSNWAGQISSLLSILQLQRQFLFFIAQSAFSLFLPAGLLLRMFFATRKLGGAIMAGSIGFFLVYPLAYSAFSYDRGQISSSFGEAEKDLSSLGTSLSALPIIDWGKPGEISQLVQNLSGNEISSRASLPYKSAGAFIGVLELYAYAYPLAALLIAFASIWELSILLGAEFKLDLFETI